MRQYVSSDNHRLHFGSVSKIFTARDPADQNLGIFRKCHDLGRFPAVDYDSIWAIVKNKYAISNKKEHSAGYFDALAGLA
jgi:hypothetical protein